MKNSLMKNSKQQHAKFEEEGFGPKIVNVNYYAGLSIDSSQASSVSKSKAVQFGDLYGTDDNYSSSQFKKQNTKRVTFNLEPEIFLVESYKKYNKLSYHGGGCKCAIF